MLQTTKHLPRSDNPASHDIEPGSIEERVRNLIYQYLASRSPAIALSVVRHVEVLCDHPGFEGGNDRRCEYLLLRRKWLWLAETNRAGVTFSNV